MSVIGPGSTGALNLAGSVAGSQRNAADAGSIRQEASERKFQIDRDAATAKSLEEVGQAETSPERDADGRRTDAGNDDFADESQTGAREWDDDSAPAGSPRSKRRRILDAFAERGRALDLEA